ncbi:MAG: metallophosphoesterase [Verrucomicrobiales bacterium]|nr:metallophosphoesterase [Verrucomicrobiales bacterium]MBP9224432.1 metallophosphoesterase [Verrucomicrobiales bacterium]HQZ27906.1 metallophosphoesterase [Verrucomicrobiales bacterium]
MIRIFHTADLHLGLKFTRGGYSPSLQDRLVAQRLVTLRGMVDLANERSCEVFVMAGDLFDTPRVTKGIVREAAETLARFDGVVIVLPGNHDYIQEEDPLWPSFVDALGERHHLLQRDTPCDLRDQGVPLVIFPAVCGSRHSKVNAVGWVPGALARLNLPADIRRVGVGHGSLEGLSPDFRGDYFPMTRKELESSGMDVWLLGHTHVRHPDRECFEGEKILFPATPEPDGFDCRHGGYAWILEVAEDGAVSGESVTTGNFRFRTIVRGLNGESDLDALKAEVGEFDSERDLVKLVLSGRLSDELHESRGEWLETMRERVLYLEDDLSGLIKEIRPADIEREYTAGSFPYRLLTALSGDSGDPEALQMAWDLVKEAKV